jgi:hypothetical protein
VWLWRRPFLTLFCSLRRPTSGFGDTIQAIAIVFRERMMICLRVGKTRPVTTDLIWHTHVPFKGVNMLAWRSLRNNLSTRDDFVRRHIITLDSQLCVIGCGGVETTHHLFLSCPVFAPLWHLIRGWVGMCHWMNRISYRTTLYSLIILQGVPELVALSCSSFGSAAFG